MNINKNYLKFIFFILTCCTIVFAKPVCKITGNVYQTVRTGGGNISNYPCAGDTYAVALIEGISKDVGPFFSNPAEFDILTSHCKSLVLNNFNILNVGIKPFIENNELKLVYSDDELATHLQDFTLEQLVSFLEQTNFFIEIPFYAYLKEVTAALNTKNKIYDLIASLISKKLIVKTNATKLKSILTEKEEKNIKYNVHELVASLTSNNLITTENAKQVETILKDLKTIQKITNECTILELITSLASNEFISETEAKDIIIILEKAGIKANDSAKTLRFLTEQQKLFFKQNKKVLHFEGNLSKLFMAANYQKYKSELKNKFLVFNEKRSRIIFLTDSKKMAWLLKEKKCTFLVGALIKMYYEQINHFINTKTDFWNIDIENDNYIEDISNTNYVPVIEESAAAYKLVVTKKTSSVNGILNIGSEMTVVIKVENISGNHVTDVRIIEALPSGWEFIPDSANSLDNSFSGIRATLPSMPFIVIPFVGWGIVGAAVCNDIGFTIGESIYDAVRLERYSYNLKNDCKLIVWKLDGDLMPNNELYFRYDVRIKTSISTKKKTFFNIPNHLRATIYPRSRVDIE